MKSPLNTLWRSLFAGSFHVLFFLSLATSLVAGPPADNANSLSRLKDPDLGKGASKPANVCPKCQVVDLTSLERGFKGSHRRVKVGERMSCPGCSRVVEIRSGKAVGESAHTCARFADNPPTCCAALLATAIVPAKPELPTTGVNLARPHGGWLNVAVEGHQFIVAFYDADKAPVPADTGHALVRYYSGVKEDQRIPLAPDGQGLKLVSPTRVRGPYVFQVRLTLRRDAPGDEEEHYAFRYP